MPIDSQWLATVRAIPDLAQRDTFEVKGVEIELPIPTARGRQRIRDWQRRVLPDIIPDSVNADASERTPFRLLFALTTSIGTKRSMDDVFAGELGPMADLFRFQASGKRKVTLAFHALAVRAAKGESDSKGFTERTVLLLCRDEHGVLDKVLVERFIEQFRRDPKKLDLAQRTLLEAIEPGWTPAQEPTLNIDKSLPPDVPFDPSAARLFREDLACLLDAELPSADFFLQLNLLLRIHLGLYQPRIAHLLNPQMEILERDFVQAIPEHVEELEGFGRKAAERHPFTGWIPCRSPDAGAMRPITLHSPSRRVWDALTIELAKFHFNVLVLAQLRRLTEAYLANRWDMVNVLKNRDANVDGIRQIEEASRTPLQLLQRLHDDPDFRTYLEQALTVLTVRFVHHQIAETDHTEAFAAIERCKSSLHALRHMYERYNNQSARTATNSRAHRQGLQVTASLLRHGQDGLVGSRPRVGNFFELGTGLLPLLILLAVGSQNEKIPVDHFWARLERYGLRFDREERNLFLERLRSMGVYERYSDAGEAAYIRNLMSGRAA